MPVLYSHQIGMLEDILAKVSTIVFFKVLNCWRLHIDEICESFAPHV